MFGAAAFPAPPNLWNIEDIIYPGYTVICISPDSPFYTSLCATLGTILDYNDDLNFVKRSHDNRFFVAQIKIDSKNWNRDPPIRTYDERFISVFCAERNVLHPDFFEGRNLPRGYGYRHLGAQGQAGAPQYQQGGPHEMDSRCFEQNVAAPRIGFHTIPIAGGNIITGRRYHKAADGSFTPAYNPTFIVGKVGAFNYSLELTPQEIFIARCMIHGITTDEFIRRGQKHVARTRQMTAQEQESYGKYLCAKILIRSFLLNHKFNFRRDPPQIFPEFISSSSLPDAAQQNGIRSNKNVIFVNQWAYHIDLQMIYIGLGVYLIHDFVQTDRFLDDVLNKIQREDDFFKRLSAHESMVSVAYRQGLYIQALQEFKANNLRLSQKYQAVVEHTYRTLTSHGFTCVKVPGLLIPGKVDAGAALVRKPPGQHGRFSQRPFDMNYRDLMNRCAFNFMNGVALNPTFAAGGLARFEVLVVGPRRGENNIYDYMCEYINRVVNADLQLKLNIHSVIIFHPVNSAGLALYAQSPDAVFQRKGSRRAKKTPQQFMLEAMGGLRCQTMTVKPTLIPGLRSTFEHRVGTNIADVRKPQIPWLKPFGANDFRGEIGAGAECTQFGIMTFGPIDAQTQWQLPELVPAPPPPQPVPEPVVAAAAAQPHLPPAAHPQEPDDLAGDFDLEYDDDDLQLVGNHGLMNPEDMA